MSMPHKEKIKCPKCGKELEYTMWQSINTQMEFAIPDIISGKLFEVICDGCGQKLHMMYPILFNDMIHNIMINYVMPEHVDEAVKASEISKSLGCRIRIVTSQESLREKTAIINSGLDDRIVELFKVFSMGQIADQIEGRNLKAMYFLPDEKQPRMEFAFEDGHGFIDIVMDAYYQLEEEFGEALADTEDDMFIDQQWALDFLNSLKQEEDDET